MSTRSIGHQPNLATQRKLNRSAELDLTPRFVYSFAAMFRAPATIGPLLASLAISVASARVVCTAAESTAIPPVASIKTSASAGVLVLHNGGILQGEITTQGDRYVVTRSGSQLEVTTSQVAFRAASLGDAYERQRQQSPHPTAESHLALAEWCLRQSLWPQAANELSAARELDPRHPKLPLLERRLEVTSAPVHHRESQIPAAEMSVPNSAAKLRELETIASELPAGSVERFIRKVQPVLVNNCTTAGCHQASSDQNFQLDRAVLHGLTNRRTTLRNLSATLALVDREVPEQSPLLTISNAPHAGRNKSPLGIRQEELHRQLSDWVALVTNTLRPSEIAIEQGATDVGGIEDPLTEPAAANSTQSLTARVGSRRHRPVMPVDTLTAEHDVLPADFEQETTLRPTPSALRLGAQIAPWQPKDEFDPEIFNRRSKNRAGGDPSAGSSSR